MELPEIKRTNILVVGEVVLDRYLWGETERISPEAPIPVLRVSRSDERPGNAAFVCASLSALGACPTVLGVVGADYAGSRLRQMLTEWRVRSTGLIEDRSRPTILKERLLGSVQSAQRATQQLLRVDHEDPRALCDVVEAKLVDHLKLELEHADGVLVCDIDKGMLSRPLLKTVIDGAHKQGKPVVVDPRRTDDYSIYRGATALTPNRFETERATGLSMKNPATWECATRSLIEQYDLAACLVTLDRDGMFLSERAGRAVHIHTTPREVYDVTGAGDVVLAVFGLLIINGFDAAEAATFANAAAGLEVAKQGAAVISRDELTRALVQSSFGTSRKHLGFDELAPVIQRHREAGKRVCFIQGSFHPLCGFHVRLLESARGQGDLLVVALNGDLGPDGTRSGTSELRTFLAGLEAVDYVVTLETGDAEEVIATIRPDVVINEDRPNVNASWQSDELRRSICIGPLFQGRGSS